MCVPSGLKAETDDLTTDGGQRKRPSGDKPDKDQQDRCVKQLQQRLLPILTSAPYVRDLLEKAGWDVEEAFRAYKDSADISISSSLFPEHRDDDSNKAGPSKRRRSDHDSDGEEPLSRKKKSRRGKGKTVRFASRQRQDDDGKLGDDQEEDEAPKRKKVSIKLNVRPQK